MLAGGALGAEAATAVAAATDDRPAVPTRLSVKVTKSGKGSALRRLAFAYPTGSIFTATCTRGREDGGPCPANGSPVEGLTCAPLEAQPETTKCELRSTAKRRLWMPFGETMTFSVIPRDQEAMRSSTTTVTFGKPGRYRITRP